MTVLAAALLGLLGSAHCVAMCGPLIVAVGTPGSSLGRRLLHVVTYHTGRLGAYALLGVLVGLAGTAVALAGLGRVVAVLAGVGLVVSGIGPSAARRWPSWTGPWMTLAARLGGAARAWQARHPITGPLAAGLANGLLPCGMVYAALATAITAGGIGAAALTMAAFGAGTVPALAGLALGVGHVSTASRRRLSGVAPLALALVGLLLMVRGLAPAARDVTALPAIGAGAHHH